MKVGNRVKVIHDYICEGEFGKIIKVDKSDVPYLVKLDSGTEWWKCETNIELVEQLFDWDEFKSSKIAVHCDTEEKANAFLKECEGHGLRWGDGAATRENNWKDYSTETCYCCYKNILAYTRKKYFAENDYTIIEYKIKEEKQLKFKVGDKVRVKENLKGEKYYSGLYFPNAMEKYRGKIIEIASIDDDGEYKSESTEDWVFNDSMLEEIKFKVGDRVEIIDNGKTYSTFDTFAEEHMGKYFKHFLRGYEPCNGETGKIVSCNKHPQQEDNLYCIFSNDKCYIIGEYGIKLAPPQKQKILITTDGIETIARKYENDKVVKTATAKCCPTDTFDFMVGAKLAMERLEDEPKVKVGDYIKLIHAPYSFSRVGDILQVTEVINGSDAVKIIGKNHIDRGGITKGFSYCYPKYCYELLKDYQPPVQYYNGEVICIEGSTGYFFTKGKKYKSINGFLLDNDNDIQRPYLNRQFKTVEEICEYFDKSHMTAARFIPYKGEAN